MNEKTRQTERKGLVWVVADNARRSYQASRFKSHRELAMAAGVAPNSVKYLLEPGSRTAGSRTEPSPRLDVLERVAQAMGYAAWQLLTPNFDPSDPPERSLTHREAEFYARIEKAYSELIEPSKTTAATRPAGTDRRTGDRRGSVLGPTEP